LPFEGQKFKMYLNPVGGPQLRPGPLGELTTLPIDPSSIMGVDFEKEVKKWERKLESGTVIEKGVEREGNDRTFSST